MSDLTPTSADIRTHLAEHFKGTGSTVQTSYGAADVAIDRLVFGKGQTEMEADLAGDARESLKAKYLGEAHCLSDSGTYWTPYVAIRSIVKHLGLGVGDTFYDLGAGYGALPIYAGTVTEAQCKGVELVAHRAEAGRRAVGHLGLDNVDILHAGVLDCDFSDGNKFYMYAPFNFPTFHAVLDRLGKIAETKPLKIITRRASGDWLDRGWLAAAVKTKIEGSGGDLLLIETNPDG